MTLATRIIGVQELAPGDTVGYGSSFTADAPLRIGVVACGYADGYPRHCTTGTPVLVDGVRTRMVGRVSMDMITVDLTPVPDAGFGSEVTLWGRAVNGAVLAIDEVAQAAGTVGYELMCALAQRVPVVGGRMRKSCRTGARCGCGKTRRARPAPSPQPAAAWLADRLHAAALMWATLAPGDALGLASRWRCATCSRWASATWPTC